MLLHLDRDRDEPLLWEETVRLEPESLGPDLVLEIGPIEVTGRVDRVDPEFAVGMDLSYEQQLACTRCLRPVPSSIVTHADLHVLTTPRETRSRGARTKEGAAKGGAGKDAAHKHAGGKNAAGSGTREKDSAAAAAAELELEKDELGVIILAGEDLDTVPLIREQVLLEVPMKPLCADDCKGLCPRCGADRNLTPDCCAEPVTDERWEALGALRDQLSAEGR